MKGAKGKQTGKPNLIKIVVLLLWLMQEDAVLLIRVRIVN